MFLPRVCVACGRELLLEEKHICFSCLCELPRTYFASRAHNPMADVLNERLQEGQYRSFSYACALFFYEVDNSGNERDYAGITKSLKYDANLGSGRYFSRLLAKELKASALYSDVDMVIPVPLHFRRQWKRGYNQAEIIAKEISKELAAPLGTGVLKRTKNTKSQTRLNTEDKMKNLENAFSVNLAKDISDKRHILIVDDVFTTGATLSQAIKALRPVLDPAARISAATLAYVGNI